MALYSLNGVAPTLPRGFAWVAETAAVMGKVELGEDVSIWFGSVLRGDNEPIVLGAKTNVQENCVFHTDMGWPLTLGEGCTIGHNAVVHGCKIGAYSLVGMGAILMNGATIGKNCVIGAGAIVTERSQIPDNSLVVGAPARVMRQIDADGETMLRQSAEHYAARARLFAAGLKRVE